MRALNRPRPLLDALVFAALVIGCALAVPGPTQAAATAPDRPNIVFILVDDLRWNALGCMGHPFAKTPNIDRLAREGMLFKNAFVVIPLCSPSRGSFLTGRYAHAHGVVDNTNHDALSQKLITFPRLLHDSGYETGYIGKWHMGNSDAPRPGFDRWVSFKGQGVYKDPPLNIDGKVVPSRGYMTDLLNDHAVEFIKHTRTNRPFALYLAHKAVHGPFTPAERHETLYENDNIERLPSASDKLEGKPALTRPLPKVAQKKAAAKKKANSAASSGPGDNVIRNQLRALASIDDGVGKIHDALLAVGHLEDTIIVFTSDNGYFWGEHGLGDKRAAYEESIRIPLIVRYPKLIKPGSVTSSLVVSVDIAPTFLELAGVDIPHEIHGKSLEGLFHNPTLKVHDSILTEYFHEPAYPRIPSWQCVRDTRWKLIHYQDLENSDELYDLETDPYELKNRLNDPEAKPVLARLRADLDAQLRRTN